MVIALLPNWKRKGLKQPSQYDKTFYGHSFNPILGNITNLHSLMQTNLYMVIDLRPYWKNCQQTNLHNLMQTHIWS